MSEVTLGIYNTFINLYSKNISTYVHYLKVYKEDLPQLKQQSKEKNHAVPFLKREKAPEDSLKLQFIHG